jgi:hypothetical protein
MYNLIRFDVNIESLGNKLQQNDKEDETRKCELILLQGEILNIIAFN